MEFLLGFRLKHGGFLLLFPCLFFLGFLLLGLLLLLPFLSFFLSSPFVIVLKELIGLP